MASAEQEMVAVLHMGSGEAVNGAARKVRRYRSRRRHHWEPSEDQKLKEFVAEHGPRHWSKIANELGGRSGKSCRLRWFDHLDPEVKRGAFSGEEEEKLVVAHNSFGNKWSLISKFLPGRTDNAVKNQWRAITARKRREGRCPGPRGGRRSDAAGSTNPQLVSHGTPPATPQGTGDGGAGSGRGSAPFPSIFSLNPDLALSRLAGPLGVRRSAGSDGRLASPFPGLSYQNPAVGMNAGVQAHRCSGWGFSGASTSGVQATTEQVGAAQRRAPLPFFDFMRVGEL